MTIHHPETVNGQYKTADRLNTRISIHDRYSRNKLGFNRWITRQLPLRENLRILELGCGTGAMWTQLEHPLPAGCTLTLTDLSQGMIESARQEISGGENVAFLTADAQNLPFADASFDLVIASMMLYHVPDIPQALSEIRRVLTPGGTLCAATFGEHGVVEAVQAMFGLIGERNHRFTLQNGQEQLTPFFPQAERRLYEDALDVTEPRDLVAYLRSLSAMAGLEDITDDQLLRAFESRMVDGVLSLPKEYGLFLCR